MTTIRRMQIEVQAAVREEATLEGLRARLGKIQVPDELVTSDLILAIRDLTATLRTLIECGFVAGRK